MASTSNTKRAKRKYGGRESITAQNRKSNQTKNEARLERLVARTQSLIGKHVTVRVKGHDKPFVGTVQEVLRKDHPDYPHEAKRHSGSYLRVRTTIGNLLTSRHRAKVIHDKNKEV